MVDNGVTKLTWIPGVDGLADPSAPTVAELTAVDAVDLSCVMVSSYEVRADASDTTNERAVCETANVVAPTVQNYMGNLVLFRDFDADTGDPETTDPLNYFEFGTTGWFVRRLGQPYTAAYAAADQIEVYKFMSDTPQIQGGTGEGYLKVTVPLLQQGVFDIKAVVAGP
jgi:hypothetical protein